MPSDDDNKLPPRKNPWAQGGANGRGEKNYGGSSDPSDESPRDTGRHGRSRGPYDQSDRLDEDGLDQIFQKIKSQFGGFEQRSHGNLPRLISIGVLILMVIWLLSGIYFIQPNQNGVVLTFGKYARTDETPGAKWRIPWPIQSVEIVDVTTERRIHIGDGNDDMGARRNNYATAQPESLMLTGDENMVDINFVVLWRVQNAKDFIFSIRDPEDTIQMVAASTMREIIGQTDIQPALTDARTKIQSDAKILMQKILDEYHAGVTINNVQLQKVDPPALVVDAFNEVQRARQKKEELKNLAEAYRNDIIPRAKGEAERLRQDAEAYKQEVVSRATGDAKRFSEIYTSYKNAKDVTSERMYLETLEQVLKSANTVVMGSQSGSNLLPLLSLDNKKLAAPAVNASTVAPAAGTTGAP